ncbi:MAG: hypothetical protein Q8S03_05865 [Brevundimonas sp.]|uniref:hypothetical protein n=1 Tax=Brevundimonas sp. TaxID=1871086 RepID=UPI0027363D2C|nr:hypothetical protein [Brevundimonas sp.]MDP3404198.1 hypothetical protein [Brevundimonas sp.]
MFRPCLAGFLLAMAASSAEAGAWAQPKGKGQIILKAEVMRASRGYDGTANLRDLPLTRKDRTVGFLGEYGLTDRVTVQLKGDWQSGEDAFVDYEGRGPVELGLTWQAYRDTRTAVSVYGGYSLSGEGRNAGYAFPGVGEQDWEVRLAIGHSLDGPGWRMPSGVRPDRSFIEVQAAYRGRSGLPDETRIDFTAGSHFGRKWMILGQAFGGMARDAGPRWLSIETSVVRNLGGWSLQAGWRRTVAGRETPLSEGAVVALWRRF